MQNTVGEYVIKRLTEDVIGLKLLPGDTIATNELAKRYEVSKTPLREAFLKLSQQNIIEISPQISTKVSLINMDIVAQYRFLRVLVEPEIVRQLCQEKSNVDEVKLYELISLQKMYFAQHDVENTQKADDAFHELLFKAAGKGEIYKTIDQVSVHYKRLNHLKLQNMANSNEYIKEHERILSAVKDWDEKRAVEEMKYHVLKMSAEKEQIMKQYPQYFK